MKKCEIKERNNKSLMGLEDCGSEIFICSFCKKDLFVAQITKTNDKLIQEGFKPIKTRIRVCCGFCSSPDDIRMIEKEIKGQIYVGSPNDETIIEFLDTKHSKEDNEFISDYISKGR